MIGHRLLPVVARIRAKLFGNMDIIKRAAERIELSPAVERFQPPAISLPDEMDHVVAFQEETTPSIEFARLLPGMRRHAATVAYRIDKAVLADGNLYFDGGYDVLRPRSAKPLLPRRRDCFNEAQLCTHSVIERYFGHWLNDGLLLELLALQRSKRALTFSGNTWLQEPAYRKLLGLPSQTINHAFVEKLWVVDDRGINANRIARFEELRRRVQFAGKPSRSTRIMLIRGKLGASRVLANGEEVNAALDKLGFEVICPEDEPVERIVEKLARAEVAVFVEGSIQNHCLLAIPAGSALLTIQPATRFTALGKGYADSLGIHWAFVVANAATGGFEVPINRLLRTIDTALNVTHTRR